MGERSRGAMAERREVSNHPDVLTVLIHCHKLSGWLCQMYSIQNNSNLLKKTRFTATRILLLKAAFKNQYNHNEIPTLVVFYQNTMSHSPATGSSEIQQCHQNSAESLTSHRGGVLPWLLRCC